LGRKDSPGFPLCQFGLSQELRALLNHVFVDPK